LENFAHEFFEAGVRAVKGAFHINDQALKLGAEELPWLKLWGKGSIKRLVALKTKVTETAVLGPMN